MASLVITRLDLPLALSTGPTEAAFVLRGGRGPRGFDGEDGTDGPNLVSDATAAGTLTDEAAATVLLVLKADGTFVRSLTATADDIGKVLGVADDGDGNPVLAWVEATTEPAYSPSLNYSDGRNSQYSLFPLLGW